MSYFPLTLRRVSWASRDQTAASDSVEKSLRESHDPTHTIAYLSNETSLLDKETGCTVSFHEMPSHKLIRLVLQGLHTDLMLLMLTEFIS